MIDETTTERPKGAPEFDPTLPCDTRDPRNFRRILCTDLSNDESPIAYETSYGLVHTTSQEGIYFKSGKQSPYDLVNVWPVLREGWTCEFIPADTEPIREGERWCMSDNNIHWIIRGIDYKAAAEVEEEDDYEFPRLRLIPPKKEEEKKKKKEEKEEEEEKKKKEEKEEEEKKKKRSRKSLLQEIEILREGLVASLKQLRGDWELTPFFQQLQEHIEKANAVAKDDELK